MLKDAVFSMWHCVRITKNEDRYILNMNQFEYLTEASLGKFLQEFFPDAGWIHDKQFCGRFRPDYRSDVLKLIVEFDGYVHYTSAKRIVQDAQKDELYMKAGYNVVHIPYFVQLSSEVIYQLFKVSVQFDQKYPHGFIDKMCILPADFCELGILRFKNDLERFEFIKSDIIQSLQNKIMTLSNIDLVLPASLQIGL